MTDHEPEGAAQRPDAAAGAPAEPPPAMEPPAALPEAEAPLGAASSAEPSPAAPPPVAPAPPIPGPIVAWDAPTAPPPPADGWPTGITVGGVLSDAFARYAADPVRIFLVGLIPAVLTIFASQTSSGSTAGITLLSLLATCITLVLVDRGPRASLRSAIWLGIRRLGWVIVTAIVAGLAIGLTAVVPVVLFINEIRDNPGLAIVIGVIGLIPVAWVLTRLTLAIPAVVVDDVNASDGLSRARQATRGRGPVLSLFAVLFLMNVAVLPASLGAGALSVLNGLPSGLVLLIGGALVAIVTPLGTIAQLSAYRRAFPPEPEPAPKVRPSWLENPIADEDAPSIAATAAEVDPAPAPHSDAPVAWAPMPAAPIATPRPTAPSPPPAFGRVARGIAGLTIAIAIVGIGAFGFAIVAAFTGSAGRTIGNVPPGSVVFGPLGNLGTCTVYGQATTVRPFTDVVFMGHFRRPATALDEVRIRVTLDGQEIVNEVEKKGTYACLGTQTPENDLDVGTYRFEMFLNNELTAEGTLVVR